MPPAVFEPAIPTNEQPQAHALDRAATAGLPTVTVDDSSDRTNGRSVTLLSLTKQAAQRPWPNTRRDAYMQKLALPYI
jgi:hypothetical protein